jgi:RNA polymerase sigma-70 factor (ECF subfamily)
VDRDLVEAARRGDREAYADLIRPRADRLFALAQRILRDVDRAEDAVQNALVIAWRDLPGLRDPDRFDSWLHRLVVRLDPQQRAILALRHFAGYEPTEIAELLGIPAGTARSRLHHAHRAMRAALEADARVPAIGGQLG